MAKNGGTVGIALGNDEIVGFVKIGTCAYDFAEIVCWILGSFA